MRPKALPQTEIRIVREPRHPTKPRAAARGSILVLLAAAGCTEDVGLPLGPPPPPPPPLAVTFEPASAAVDVGESVDLTVRVTGGNPDYAATITCGVSNAAVSVSTDGLQGACRVTGAVAPGEATVTVVVTRGQEMAAAEAAVTVR